MIYHVRAWLRDENAAELLRKLTDGTIANQRPDGPELVAAMKRAVVNSDGMVEWSEMCFCATPLHHERETVLDAHFSDLTTDPIEGHAKYEGRGFMGHLAAVVG